MKSLSACPDVATPVKAAAEEAAGMTAGDDCPEGDKMAVIVVIC